PRIGRSSFTFLRERQLEGWILPSRSTRRLIQSARRAPAWPLGPKTTPKIGAIESALQTLKALQAGGSSRAAARGLTVHQIHHRLGESERSLARARQRAGRRAARRRLRLGCTLGNPSGDRGRVRASWPASERGSTLGTYCQRGRIRRVSHRFNSV